MLSIPSNRPGYYFRQCEEVYKYYILCKLFKVVCDRKHLHFVNKMDQHSLAHSSGTRPNVDNLSVRQPVKNPTPLSPKHPHPPTKPLTFNGQQNSDQNKIASAFCKQWATIVPHTSDPKARCVGRQLLRDYPLDHNTFLFTTIHFGKAIKESTTLQQLAHMASQCAIWSIWGPWACNISHSFITCQCRLPIYQSPKLASLAIWVLKPFNLSPMPCDQSTTYSGDQTRFPQTQSYHLRSVDASSQSGNTFLQIKPPTPPHGGNVNRFVESFRHSKPH